MLGGEFELDDLSMTGLAVLSANDNALNVGVATTIELVCGTSKIFRSEARIVRSAPHGEATQLGLKLEGGYIDIARLCDAHRQHLIARELVPGFSRAMDIVPTDFRRACADALDMVRSCKPFLDKVELENSGEEHLLLDAVEKELTPAWMALCNEIDQILARVADDDMTMRELKRYAERVVTPEFCVGPIWERAYNKPLGYPGDFGILDYIYRSRDAGASLYGRLLHRLGLASLECVRTRMVMMRDILSKELARHDVSDPLQVISIGCGASEEIRQALLGPVSRPAEFTLIDQDDRALDASFERIYPETMRHNGVVSLNCLQTGFQRLVDPRRIDPTLPPQDIIYSLGILDYLKQPRAKRFCHALYRRLKPGGRLVVANVQDLPDNGRWRAECLSDWTLIYRSREEMEDLAHGIDGEWEVREDSTRNILMLIVCKPETAA